LESLDTYFYIGLDLQSNQSLGRPCENNNKLGKFMGLLRTMVFWPQNPALLPFKLTRSSWKKKKEEERKRERLSEHQNPRGNHRN